MDTVQPASTGVVFPLQQERQPTKETNENAQPNCASILIHFAHPVPAGLGLA